MFLVLWFRKINIWMSKMSILTMPFSSAFKIHFIFDSLNTNILISISWSVISCHLCHLWDIFLTSTVTLCYNQVSDISNLYHKSLCTPVIGNVVMLIFVYIFNFLWLNYYYMMFMEHFWFSPKSNLLHNSYLNWFLSSWMQKYFPTAAMLLDVYLHPGRLSVSEVSCRLRFCMTNSGLRCE